MYGNSAKNLLSLVQSPIASFLYHPKFKDAVGISTFQRGGGGGGRVGQIGESTGSAWGIITKEQVIKIMGRF